MGQKTKIEYLDYSWSPFAMRCQKTSAGCANCWHLKLANRFAGNQNFSPEIRAAYAGDGSPVLVESRLNWPKTLKDGSIIGLQFMGDILFEKIAWRDIEQVWQVMLDCPQHRFLILTKRPRRGMCLLDFPDHIWPGVSIETKDYMWRLQELLKVDAVHRWLSIEPMLGPILLPYEARGNLSVVVCGCESGHGRRPMEKEWVYSLRDQCQLLQIPFFLKQMEIEGEIVSMPMLDGEVWDQWPKP